MGLLSIFNKKSSDAERPDRTSHKSKNRKAADYGDVQNEQLAPEKKRARRRLIGAVAMVLAVVIGLPLVFDSEPKSINKNIEIQTPSKNISDIALLERTNQETPLESEPEPETESKSDANAEVNSTTSLTMPKEAAKGVTKKIAKEIPNKREENKPASELADGERALAILNGTDVVAAEKSSQSNQKAANRVVIQVGAFATQEKVNELRNKLKAAGIRSYTQKVATSSGDKIRVRIGPFEDIESADKVKAQLRKLDLNATMIPM